MSSRRIEDLVAEAQAAFDRRPTDVETGLDVVDGSLLQLRKACRLLSGARRLLDVDHFTLVIEASSGNRTNDRIQAARTGTDEAAASPGNASRRVP